MIYHPLTLSFTGKWRFLETRFNEIDHRESLPRIRLAVAIAMLFYAGFAILDAVIAPQQKALFWLIRFAVVCPLGLVFLLYSFHSTFIRYSQLCLLLLCVAGGAGIVAMIVTAPPMAAYSYYAGIILIFIMIFTIIRMRFLWGTVCSWLIVAIYEVGAVWLTRTPVEMVINNNFFFISATIFCMMAGYSMESNLRKRFFYSHMMQMAKDELSRSNLELDRRVQERTRELVLANEQLQEESRERIELEKELFKVQKLEAIGTLSGGIAHDFNNILTAVIGYSEINQVLLDEGTDPHVNMGKILQACLRGKALTRQILTFSRKVEQNVAPVNLAYVAREALELIRATIPAMIEMVTNLNSRARIIGDENQLHRVILNLCTNAYHAIGAHSGRIEIRIEDVTVGDTPGGQRTLPPAGEYVCFELSDTGTGIPAEILDNIFDPFFTTKPVGQGTGMGLSVVHGIVNREKTHSSTSSRSSQAKSTSISGGSVLPGFRNRSK